MVPPVLIARLTAQTMSIRVGAGGVMLPNHFRSSSPSGSRRLHPVVNIRTAKREDYQ
jgi:hypothetical protein